MSFVVGLSYSGVRKACSENSEWLKELLGGNDVRLAKEESASMELVWLV